MKKEQFVGAILIFCVVAAVAISILAPSNEDSWYTLIGLTLFIFSTWGGIILLKIKNNE